VAYEVVRSEQADLDLDSILDHLIRTHLAFGEDDAGALELAAARLRRIHSAMERLGRVPHQGTLHPDMLPGLRSVTKERAILYFVADDDEEQVRVLAVFFGGEDHQREMLKRMVG
jgi:toxin ParE1/3/4